MSAYDNVSGGSLKFKGGDTTGIKKKKKKSKSDKEKLARAIRQDDNSKSDSAARRIQVITKTEAELKFEEIQRKRQMERVAKAAAMSHKERVQEFNQKLEKLSEHHDIPKVGPG